MTKLVEQNYFDRQNNFKILTREVQVPDDGKKLGRAMKYKKLAKLRREREAQFKLIQLYQLKALKSTDDYEIRQALEYVKMILRPHLIHLDNEITGILAELQKKTA